MVGMRALHPLFLVGLAGFLLTILAAINSPEAAAPAVDPSPPMVATAGPSPHPQRPARSPDAARPGTLAATADTKATEDGDRTVVAELTARDMEPPSTGRGEPQEALAKLVVLISVDGLRPDVVYPHARTIHGLTIKGASAIHSRTISKSSTLPSHASMVSGVDVDQHGLSFNSYRPERGHIQYPTIFSEAQKAGLATALFVGKRKLEHLLNPDTVAHFEVGGVFCNKVTDLAVPHLRTARPGVVFVHFSDPDGAGHRYGWMTREYIKAVRRADRCVADVLEALDERGDMDRTLVLVTSDHGGHDHNHGTRRRLDKRIPWVLYGAGVKAKGRIKRTVYNTDTAATIFHALGVEPPPTIVGRPVLEAFEDSEA